MIGGLVLAELRHRPGRALFLLTGYAFGVAVVVVLLSVGEAMLSQARDRSLFGGGDLLVLPAGMSVEMLRGGGTTSLFLELEQARFLQRQILESPRAREGFGVVSASPILEGQPVEIAFEGRTARALASGEIPGRARAAGAAPRLLGGTWVDSDLDRRWADPTTTELLHEIDAFHLPYGSAVGDSTWAEWHYFNVRLDDDRWFYLTFMVAGRVGVAGEWGGRVLLSVRDPRDGHRQLVRDVPADGIVLDTLRADLRLDAGASVRVEEGAYHLLARVDGAEIDLRVDSSPHRYFPPAEMGGEAVVSGYVVPALAGRASGRVCLPVGSAARCADVVDAPA